MFQDDTYEGYMRNSVLVALFSLVRLLSIIGLTSLLPVICFFIDANNIFWTQLRTYLQLSPRPPPNHPHATGSICSPIFDGQTTTSSFK